MEREYFDAKFEGLEKLMAAQQSNLSSHIVAVSTNVTILRADLQTHKESTEAHGIASSRNSSSIIASWLGLFVAAIVGLAEFVKSHRGP